MSQRSNQNLRFWKDVVTKLRCTPHEVTPGKLASDEQNESIADCYGLTLMVWADLTSIPMSPPQIANCIHIMNTNPLSEVFGCLKEADNVLLEEIQVERVCSFDDFKHRIGIQYPTVIGLLAAARGLWKELREAENRSLSATDLHTYFAFPLRLNLKGRDDLMCEARRKYLDKEISLGSQYVYTSEERDIISAWFPNDIQTYESIFGSWVPKHGNGAVADLRSKSPAAKYHSLGVDDDLAYLDEFVGGLGYPRQRGCFRRVSQVQFVPKSFDKLRTICMEPATLMFYQEGFMDSIVRYFGTHRYLRKRIDLSQASLNCRLAQEGSISGKYATIDLSDASDSVSLRLVRQWFAHSPLLLALELTRSTHYNLDGQVLEANKFAAMGSALCFPVECIVFAAMCEATIRESGGDPYHSNYRVYGDDIIIETRYAEPLLARLIANGFTPNKKKSFFTVTPHNFRESCGGEYLDGDSIAPIRLSRFFSGLTIGRDASRYEALIELANDSYYHLPTVRRFIVSELLSLPQPFLPLFSDTIGNGSVFSTEPTNYRSKRRWNSDWQREQIQHGCTRAPVGRIVPKDEDIRYYDWLRSHSARTSNSPLSECRNFISYLPPRGPRGTNDLASRWS